MKYKVIVFDIDGTITKHVSSWRYIHEKLGLWDVLAKKYQQQFLAGKINYRKFCELDAAHWKGMDAGKLYDVFNNVKYSKNAEKVVKKFKKQGFKLAAISTGLQFVTEKIKRDLRFDYVMGNRLNVYRGRLTGGVKINISHGAKGVIFRKILSKLNVKPREVIAVGDSDGDIPMLKLAGYSIAFNSSSHELSRIVDYECVTKDFKEIYDKVMNISSE